MTRLTRFLRSMVLCGCAISWLGLAPVLAAVDPKAEELARAVMQKMGGQASWNATRYVRWDFFGGRRHWWDRFNGDIRIEAEQRIVLMNIHTLKGRVWQDGQELAPGEELDEALVAGHQWWVNDSYWMFMPYKLLDPGVNLQYAGQREMEDGRPADVLEMTFGEGIGYTPQNRYEIFVAQDTGLVEAWSFYADASDAEPRFTMPWAGWERFGKILLANSRGRDKDWNISVPEELPESVFRSPEPVDG